MCLIPRVIKYLVLQAKLFTCGSYNLWKQGVIFIVLRKGFIHVISVIHV